MARLLYDLAGADPALRFSPFCWRTRLALACKRLEVETTPWRFTEKDRLAFARTDKVPVLVDGDRVVIESWDIAVDLDTRYPDRPSLFGGDAAQAVTRMVNAWTDSILHPWIARLVVRDLLDQLAPQDQAYFRTSREARFGRTLEDVQAGREAALPEFQKSLQPIRLPLRAQPFLGGAAPAYADFIVFGAFQWARCASAFPLLAGDDPVHAWRERMLDLYDGLARAVPGHAVG